ncbi:vitamin B6 photo-protection and homoeostasis-domain-containing protein [Blyttiomyces helicus]|uniref:Vitamin B6 photo-protection and homoeostasis-domain-containing protein n=1 Tax=Blyttiomyces helicus TaxID=388810 RepID=A0A4P9WL83_9FUNG|nr:vitamin B6 photo-protection and homoeostasis-domain-containing protein [Blyttiomyces helicus]|eukprot:RKO92823.1 vitamin B6 photo-protection and homoeostasis-domain-containing protein [Blyttiomyces helicus]
MLSAAFRRPLKLVPHRRLHSPPSPDHPPLSKASREPIVVKQRVRRGETIVWTVLKLVPDSHSSPPPPSSSPDSRPPTSPPPQPTKWTTTRHVVLPPSRSPSATAPRSRPLLPSLREKLATAFLPRGYPNSTTPDFTLFTAWQTLQTVTGTITGTLATQALLHALGVGAGTAAGLAATTNWVIKDGIGLLGGVIYASMMGGRFDAAPKRYRMIAALSIQAATIAELLTPFVPHLFLPMASLSNAGKNIGWLASSATRASMSKGFAKEDNLGDITAKAGAQGTAAALIGTAMGVGIGWTAGGGSDPTALMWAFVPVCIANVCCAYMANSAVVTRTINLERGELIARDWARARVLDTPDDPDIPTPEAVSKRERFMLPYRSLFAVPICLEPPLAPRLAGLSADRARAFIDGPVHAGERYRVMLADDLALPKSRFSFPSHRFFSPPTALPSPVHHPTLCLWFLESACTTDVLRAFHHANLARALIEDGGRTTATHGDRERVLLEARRLAHDSFEEFAEGLRKGGWDMEHAHLQDRNARIAF